ncbi:hypothetical protein [Pseudonocardia sp. ICBG601]|uniref:hypothetical protein n=1 Tax=Pseudonocardia sp. ICBG601 TaxID=2846759 RepID=UPI001CF6A59A|nr:hypothetical protein [Pseudonocardia sp. ICBG601]
MTALDPRRRPGPRTAREIAEKVGVSERTVVRLVAEPRAAYEHRARLRRTTVIDLKLQGLTCGEIASRTGYSRGAVCRLLYDARRNGEWAAAAEHRIPGHVE